MPKKIVICCDGTGNEIKENQSNVLKVYRVLKKPSFVPIEDAKTAGERGYCVRTHHIDGINLW